MVDFENYDSFITNLREIFSSDNQILLDSFNQKNTYINILSEKGKGDIQYLCFKKTEYNENCCPISQEPFKEAEIVACLPCKHIFNKKSILQWLTEESHKCPVCRFEMDFIEKKIEVVNNVTPSAVSNVTPSAVSNVTPSDVTLSNVTPRDISDLLLNAVSNIGDTGIDTTIGNRFYNFMDNLYQHREDREIQLAIEASLDN
jgi:hypothetical protein